MVRPPMHNGTGDPMGTPGARGSPIPGERRDFPSLAAQGEVGGLSPEWERLLGESSPLAVVETVQRARAPSPRSLYGVGGVRK